MKIKQKKETREKTMPELQKALREAKEALFQLSLDHKTHKLKDTTSLTRKRKEIAVLVTFMREKEIVNESA